MYARDMSLYLNNFGNWGKGLSTKFKLNSLISNHFIRLKIITYSHENSMFVSKRGQMVSTDSILLVLLKMGNHLCRTICNYIKIMILGFALKRKRLLVPISFSRARHALYYHMHYNLDFKRG